MPDVTVDMLLNVENYGELFHRHLPHCFSTIDSDQLCSKTATSVKYSKILEILSEFENISADEHILNLCTTLEQLGSL